MSLQNFLYRINEQKLKNCNVSLPRPSILKFIQEFDGELKNGETLRCFKEPKLDAYPLDMNAIAYPEETVDTVEDNSIKVLEHFICEKDLGGDFTTEPGCERIKVFTQRRVLSWILKAPYNRHWKFVVTVLRQGNLIFMTIAKQNHKNNYHKGSIIFAKLCETTPASDEAHKSGAASVKPGYFIYGTQVEKFDLFYSDNAAAVWSDKPIQDAADIGALNKCCFVSPKLLSEALSKYWMRTHPALTWWTRGFLSNIDKIFIAFTNHEHVINEPAVLHEVDAIREVQRSRVKACEAFLHKFLKLVEESTSADDAIDMVHNYHFDGKGNITLSKQSGETQFPFLSADFMEYMRSQ